MELSSKIVSGILLTLLLMGMLTSVFNIQQVRASEPPPTEWSKTYGGAEADYAYSLVQTNDGGYALAGVTYSYGTGVPDFSDFWLVKTDSAGNMQWNKAYGGEDVDAAYSVVETSDGGYALAGSTRSYPYGDDEFWLVKTDSAGSMEWNQTYGGTNEDIAYSVVQTNDGGYAIAGYTNSFGAGSWDFWLVKADSAGNMQWNRTYGGAGDDYAYSLGQTDDGGYAIAGTIQPYGMPGDFWLVKTDSVGNAQWNRTYGIESAENCRSMIQADDGGYALAGRTYSYSTGLSDFWLVKTDSAGAVQWNKTYGVPGNNFADSLVQTSDGGYALTGVTYPTYSYGAGGGDFWLVKTDAAGNMQWNKTYGGTSEDIAYSVVQTNDGGYAVAGTTKSFGAGIVDFWLVKLGTPAHELVVSITAPASITLGSSSSLNATVMNEGLNDEVDVELSLFINGTLVDSANIPLLNAGNLYTLSYLWSPTVEGTYNVTAYAHPVAGETSTENNQETKFVTVSITPTPPEVQVGVKAGDWIKVEYTISGWPSGQPYPEWLKVEFLTVEGTNATLQVTMHMSDVTEQNATVPVVIGAGGGEAFGLSGFVIPANLTVGDSVYITGYGNITIAGETTRTYAGASRTVVYASFSQYGTQLTYYWDKQTGVMVEASTTSGGVTATAKATETNMWQAAPGFPIDPIILYALIPIIIVIVTAIFLVRRKKKLPEIQKTETQPQNSL
jgi:hypothetical protein